MKLKIGVIGLGYVGLPLAVEFAKTHDVVGFDINHDRVQELGWNIDRSKEVSEEALRDSNVKFTNKTADLRDCTVYIITVPTPIDSANKPDLTPLIQASVTVGRHLRTGDTVIYESTVYPGATEEVCVPILEEYSHLTYNEGFFVGYSPERINPGDKEKGVRDVMKVTSGSNPEIATFVSELYSEIIDAGVFQASSLKVAEAAKVIENTQRDINIALINELAMIFHRLDIDTEEVLKAAGTKWNFLPFRPGVVGGHCIGIDPFYLTHKAQEVGYHPEIILSGRRVNDGMGAYIGSEVVKKMAQVGVDIPHAKVLIMGYTFKENCPDTRNTKVVDIINELQQYNINIDVFDMWLDKDIQLPNGVNQVGTMDTGMVPTNEYDAIVISVAHKDFKNLGIKKIRNFGKPGAPVFDIKHMFAAEDTDWRL